MTRTQIIPGIYIIIQPLFIPSELREVNINLLPLVTVCYGSLILGIGYPTSHIHLIYTVGRNLQGQTDDVIVSCLKWKSIRNDHHLRLPNLPLLRVNGDGQAFISPFCSPESFCISGGPLNPTSAIFHPLPILLVY